jgi:hypothetical protein
MKKIMMIDEAQLVQLVLNKTIPMIKVAVIMGSISDMPVMQEAIEILKGFDIEIEVDIVSAHRTPEKNIDFSKMHTRGISYYCRCWRSSSPAWYGSINVTTSVMEFL